MWSIRRLKHLAAMLPIWLKKEQIQMRDAEKIHNIIWSLKQEVSLGFLSREVWIGSLSPAETHFCQEQGGLAESWGWVCSLSRTPGLQRTSHTSLCDSDFMLRFFSNEKRSLYFQWLPFFYQIKCEHKARWLGLSGVCPLENTLWRGKMEFKKIWTTLWTTNNCASHFLHL